MTNFPTLQFRYLFNIVSGSTPESGKGFYWDGEIPWITPEDVSQVNNGYFLVDTRRKITEEGYENAGVTLVPPKSIVLTKRAPIGTIAILGIEACSNQGCFLLVPKLGIDSRFYYYFLYAHKSKLQILGRGSTFMELSLDEMKAFTVPKPELYIQEEIANYLDRETAHIDSLIQAKENLLAILAEKRQALITQAVTRGLNPDVHLKPSGVDWLSNVPEHWDVVRTRWLFKERNERSETGEEEMLTVSHITGVTSRSEKDVNMFEAKSNEGYKICFPDDLVINTLWAWMGAMGISPLHGIVSPAYHVYTPLSRVEPAYIDTIVRLPVFASEVTRYSKGVWSSRLRLYPEGLYEVFLPVPPLDEQRQIVDHIKAELNKINKFESAAEQSITLLKERRSALITAAVTGQIDVTQNNVNQKTTSSRASVV